MDHLDQLEQQSVFIFREAFRHFERLCMLWSIGKDSTVLLWLARKAFFGHVPFPLVHIDTNYKLPEMIRYRDKLAMEYKLQMVVGQNRAALDAFVSGFGKVAIARISSIDAGSVFASEKPSPCARAVTS